VKVRRAHPICKNISVVCNCGNFFVIVTSLQKNELRVDVCFNCHPFYTGKQKIIDSAGMVEIFNRRYRKG
jgi:large subunit ribosomal protein L31